MRTCNALSIRPRSSAYAAGPEQLHGIPSIFSHEYLACLSRPNRLTRLASVQGHDDDIKCMAMHPDRFTVATGQVASALDGSYDNPFVCIWDVRDPLGMICRLNFPSDGAATRCGVTTDDAQRRHHIPCRFHGCVVTVYGEFHPWLVK